MTPLLLPLSKETTKSISRNPKKEREEIRGSSEKTKKGGNGPLLLLQKQNERVVSGVSKRDGLMIEIMSLHLWENFDEKKKE